MDERIFSIYSWGILVFVIVEVSTINSFAQNKIFAPKYFKISIADCTSSILGTFCKIQISSCYNVAAIIGKTAFFEPCITVSPNSGQSPTMDNFDINDLAK